MTATCIRSWQPSDDVILEAILRAQITEDPAWPPAYAHGLELSTWLGEPANLGRWVATNDQGVVAHMGLAEVRGVVADAFAAATGYPPDAFAELCRTVVAPTARGGGVAGALTRHALKAALKQHRIPVATVLTGRGSWLQMMLRTGWQAVGETQSRTADERLVLLLAPSKFVSEPAIDGR